MIMQASDGEILAAFRRDMDEGGRLLFGRYYKPLVLFSSGLIDDADRSEDVVQDVFYQFIKGKVYEEITAETLSSYLFTSVKHRCLNELRGQRTYVQLEVLRQEAMEEEAVTYSPELVKAIREAVEHLPEKTRLTIQKVVMGGKTYKQAAAELDVSVNTVKTLLSRGLKELRRQFPDPILFFMLMGKINMADNQ